MCWAHTYQQSGLFVLLVVRDRNKGVVSLQPIHWAFKNHTEKQQPHPPKKPKQPPQKKQKKHTHTKKPALVGSIYQSIRWCFSYYTIKVNFLLF